MVKSSKFIEREGPLKTPGGMAQRQVQTRLSTPPLRVLFSSASGSASFPSPGGKAEIFKLVLRVSVIINHFNVYELLRKHFMIMHLSNSLCSNTVLILYLGGFPTLILESRDNLKINEPKQGICMVTHIWESHNILLWYPKVGMKGWVVWFMPRSVLSSALGLLWRKKLKGVNA